MQLVVAHRSGEKQLAVPQQNEVRQRKKKETKWTYRQQQYNLDIKCCDVATEDDHGDMTCSF